MTAEAAKAAIEPWLAPISEAEPGGAKPNAHPLYNELLTEVGKLESPTGGLPDWERVLREGEQFTREVAKDVKILSYAAGAFHETGGLLGLASGLYLLAEHMDVFWESMWPAVRRIRGRVGAIDWLTARLDGTLASTPVGAGDHDAVDALEAAYKRFRAVCYDKFEDSAPALNPLKDAIERLKISLPPRPETPGSAEGGPAEGGGAEAPAPASAPSPAPTPAAPAPAAAPAKEDEAPDFEAELKVRAEPYLAPIRDDAPAGDDTRYDDDGVALRNEIKELESPTGDAVEWDGVVSGATDLLRGKSKDLQIASFLAGGLYETQSLDGLATGLSVVAEIADTFWDGLFPKRERGRNAAVAWLLGRLEHPLENVPPTDLKLVEVQRLQVAAKRFASVMRARFESPPATTALLNTIERMLMSVPKEAEPAPPPPPPPTETAPTTVRAPPAGPPPSTATPVATPSLGNVQMGQLDPGNLRAFTGPIVTACLDAASSLRKASPADPASYRIARMALALDTIQAPPPQQGNKTGVPAPADSLVRDLEARIAKGDFDTVLDAAESGLRAGRFWLDLHRYSAVALTGKGEAFEAAKAEVVAGAAYFVKRYPQLLELTFNNGMPLASDATKGWIGSEVLPAGEGGSGGDELDPRIAEGQGLLAGGKRDEGLKLLAEVGRAGSSGRARFQATMAVAKALAVGKTLMAAVGIFEGLLKEAEAVALDRWEPELAAECYRSHYSCLQQIDKPNDAGLAARREAVFHRLCQVDPLAALSAAG